MRRLMMRRLAGLGFALVALVSCTGTPGPGEEQALVDRATLSVQEILGEGNDKMNAARMLRRARAAMICPRIFRAGFFFGGAGGGCVLLGRDAAGSWSSPAFYTLGSGTFGLQAGIQDMQILMLIMNDKALSAILDSQLKLGADASITVATLGGSLEGATTAAVGADILAYARARGLYAGLTLDGSLISARSEWNRNYYRQEIGPREIVVAMRAHNPGADPLRAALLRYGSGGATAAPAAAADNPAGFTPGNTLGSGPVQQSTLPPLR
jgi:SH3 domain-containing YSC84-like protein 1